MALAPNSVFMCAHPKVDNVNFVVEANYNPSTLDVYVLRAVKITEFEPGIQKFEIYEDTSVPTPENFVIEAEARDAYYRAVSINARDLIDQIYKNLCNEVLTAQTSAAA